MQHGDVREAADKVFVLVDESRRCMRLADGPYTEQVPMLERQRRDE
jgi:hypothetical protein